MRADADVERARTLLGGFSGDEGLSHTKTLSDVQSGIIERIARLIDPSIHTGSQQKKLFLSIVIKSLVVLAIAIFLKSTLPIFLILTLPVLERLKSKRKIFKRAEAFERDYTALLLSLASSVRTGMDPMAALSKSATLFSSKSVVKEELETLNGDIERGVNEENIIRGFAQSVAHPDIDLFRSALILARKEGSSLGECLQRLAKVTRQRQSFRRKISSAVAMQKMSAMGVAACVILIGAIQFSSNKEGVLMALRDPVGIKMFIVGIALVFGGLWYMLRLGTTRI